MTANLERDVISLAASQPALLASVGKADVTLVVLADDDPIFRKALADRLSKQGFTVQSFADGATLLSALDAVVDADVIILQRDLPEMPGIDLLAKLRRQGVNVPVVLLNGQAQRADECLAFEKGATDVVCKPRSVEVLVGRLASIVKAAKARD